MSKKLFAFAPGRTEIAGNHVDHQHGIAMTGSLSQGISADVELRDDDIILIDSEGFDTFEVDINKIPNYKDFDKSKHYTTEALVAGVAFAFKERGIDIHGFNAKISSTIGSGMGLSSSAAFELLIGVILNEAYNEGKLSKMELAQIGLFAEYKYFNKPSGLLDQTAISYGGIILIDFKDPNNLKVEPIDFSFEKANIGAVLVDSKVQHGDISNMYAAIPGNIKSVANLNNVEYLRDLDKNKFMENISASKNANGEKSTMRAIHYYHEMNLVEKRIQALKDNDAKLFMYLHGLSGSSSAEFLQNTIISEENQATSYCQAICELCLDEVCNGDFSNRGASRIHGGGFGGCIQVFLPIEQVDDFCKRIDDIYGQKVANLIEFSDSGAYAKFV